MIKNRAIQGIRSWKKLLLSVWLLLSLYPWMTLTAATGAALSGFHDCFMMTGTLLQQVFVVYQKFFPVMAAGCSAYYLSRKRDGCVVLSAVVAYLTLTTVLNADILNEAFYYLKWKVDSACMYIDNPLTGMFCGYCAAKLYDSYSTIPDPVIFMHDRRVALCLSDLFFPFPFLQRNGRCFIQYGNARHQRRRFFRCLASAPWPQRADPLLLYPAGNGCGIDVSRAWHAATFFRMDGI